MTNPETSNIEDLVLDSDTGARRPEGTTLKISLSIALLWSLFQLWISSPLPYFFAEHSSFFKKVLLDSNKTRYIHLAFALLLTYINYPYLRSSPKNRVPIYDWIIMSIGVFTALYLIIFYNDLSARAGAPTGIDIFVSITGIILLLEATRRSLGPPLAIIATTFLLYSFFGQYMPDLLAHKGHNLAKISSHQWLSTEGVFGIAIGVSASYVFLFVLFGSLLERAGAGNYFIQVAFSMLGHMKGGPAKAAVLSSGMTGLISGSSIANVVTTGTFTIPLMRKVGFSKETAGAVEVASSVNGQIMPPVMGAAAFLMVEYLGISYNSVVKHAFIPAVISYIALLYIVHIEAVKNNMRTLPKRHISSAKALLMRMGIISCSIIILSGIFYYFFSFIKNIFGAYSIIATSILLAFIYVALLKIKSYYPDLDNDPDKEITELPELKSTARSGLHFLLPIAILVWFLMVEKSSPGLAAFWACLAMMFIMITENIVMHYYRNGVIEIKEQLKKGLSILSEGLTTGAKNMAAIGVATAAAGIVVGAVTQTGVGNKMTELIEVIAGNSTILMLIFTAIICIILGMGLPTTANYIVVSSLMAGVVVELGKQNGLIIPIVAVHFFVFYFGIMADVTPPVGLASFAAAAISGGDPLRTSFKAFVYSIRTMILPFLFIFDPKMLLIGVDSLSEAIFIFVKSTIAILVFTASTQGYFIMRSKLYESLLLGIIAFSIFLPSFWVNRIVPEYKEYNPTEIYQLLDESKNNEAITLKVIGEDFFGDKKQFFTKVKFSEGKNAQEKLDKYGLSLYENEGKLIVANTKFASQAEKDGFSFDYEIVNIKRKREQFSEGFIYIPTILLLAGIYILQRRRKKILQ